MHDFIRGCGGFYGKKYGRMQRHAWLLALLLSATLGQAEEPGQAGADIDVLYVTEDQLDVRIDGRLDDAIWDQIQPIDGHLVIEPATMKKPAHRTDVLLVHSERGLYAGFRAFQPQDKALKRLSARDARFNRDDVHITLDHSGSGLYGHWFSIALGDSLSDGTVLPERVFYNEWDGSWRGVSAESDYGWSAEMFIPWSILSLPKSENGITRVGFYTSRKAGYLNERYAFPALSSIHSKFMSALPGLRLRAPPRKQAISLQPFVSAETESVRSQDRFRAGLDLHWRPHRNLLLSASLAPDFGTTESDDVVLNLGALETFFSEKRPFFLEGRSVFFTSPRVSGNYNAGSRFILVNTRRIGAPVYGGELAPSGFGESQFDQVAPTDLYGAVRLNGQGKNFRYGVLAAFEEARSVDLTPTNATDAVLRARHDGQNFAAARFVYEKKSRESYRALGVFGTHTEGHGRRALVAGVDFHLLTEGGVWGLDTQLLYSDTQETTDFDSPLDQGRGLGWTLDLQHVPRLGFQHSLHVDYFGRNFEVNDLGYLRRNDQIGTAYYIEKNFPDFKWAKWIDSLEINARFVHNWNHDGQLNRAGYFLNTRIATEGLARLRTSFGFFPPRWEDVQSVGNGVFRVKERGFVDFSWETNSSKRVIGGLELGLRVESLGGWSQRVGGSLKLIPSDHLNLEFSATYEDRNGWLIYTSGRTLTTYNANNLDVKLKAELFINARNQLSTSLQWVGVDAVQRRYFQTPDQAGALESVAIDPAALTNRNFAISELVWQTKYRWEFAPLSELIFVYNHFADPSVSPASSFGNLFDSAFNQPIIKQLILKVRYRYDG